MVEAGGATGGDGGVELRRLYLLRDGEHVFRELDVEWNVSLCMRVWALFWERRVDDFDDGRAGRIERL